MATHTSTVRGRIFKTPLALRYRLEYVRDLLDWAYAFNRSGKEIQRTFWEWYNGVYANQVMQAEPHAWKTLMRDTADWDWPAMKRRVRETIEGVLRPKGKVQRLRPIEAPRGLGIWEAEDGKRYFHYSTIPNLALAQDSYADAAVDMMLTDLHGISTEVMHECEVCGRLFVGLRPTRSRYCSGVCRNRAFLKAHGFTPPTARARKPYIKDGAPAARYQV